MVFAICMNSATVPGTMFKKHLEIAKGLLSEDDDLLAEIIFSPHSLAKLEGVTASGIPEAYYPGPGHR
jgi:hypothetical protein